jgi:hypothetical protein
LPCFSGNYSIKSELKQHGFGDELVTSLKVLPWTAQRVFKFCFLLPVLLTQLSSQELPGVHILGRLRATIVDGDFVHPIFSPDGTKLAYSSVEIEPVCNSGSGKNCPRTELSQIWVRDLIKGTSKRILSSEQSKKYMTYSAFVADLSWPNNQTVKATLLDGDVDACVVSFAATSGRRLHEDCSSMEGDEDNAGRDLKRIFPKESSDWLLRAAASKVKWPTGGTLYLVPKPGWSISDSDWSQRLVIVKPINEKVWLPLSPFDKGLQLLSGYKFGRFFVISLGNPSMTRLVGLQGMDVGFELTLPVAFGKIQPILTSVDWFIFMLSPETRAVANRVWALDRAGKLHSVDEQVVEASASLAAKKIALVRWDPQEKKRLLEIRDLRLPESSTGR